VPERLLLGETAGAFLRVSVSAKKQARLNPGLQSISLKGMSADVASLGL
jgi:hypothetical protein